MSAVFSDDPPASVPNDSRYAWIGGCSDGSAIELNFTTFDTEAGYDFVNVHDGTSEYDRRIGRFSGNTLPPAPIQALGSDIFIQVHLISVLQSIRYD
eukprot:COSAG05_NODE_49_length_24373_cov_16.162561_29_plen_97_part_00